MSKGKKAVIIIVAIVVVLAVAAGIILMPRHGKTVADTWSPYDTYGGQKWIRTIEKQPGKDFKILQITDTQLYMLPGDNKKALELTKELVTQEKPDLVVLTGDNVSALFTDWLLDDVIDCMESLGVRGRLFTATTTARAKPTSNGRASSSWRRSTASISPGRATSQARETTSST